MSEVGIIGQMYEDRRTKKVGKLLERDEKYKTLLFESSDEKTFNVSFSGFKSNWRKFETTVEEQVVVENVVETDVTVNNTSEKIPVKKSAVVKEQKIKPVVDDFSAMFDNFAKSFSNDSILMSYNQKKNVAILKFNRSKVIDFYVRSRGFFWIMLPEVIYSSTNWEVPLTEVVNTPTNRREISCRIMFDDMPTALENMRTAIIQLLCDNNINEEE